MNTIIHKWAGISGSWRRTNAKIEEDVRKIVREIIIKDNGIVTGGALNVDYFAIDEALEIDPKANHIKIFLPTTISVYAAHYRKRMKEGIITKQQAEGLIAQLTKVKEANKFALIENKKNKIVDNETYFQRNTEVVKASDELYAFQVNESSGVQDTIEKAKQKGIPVYIFSYTI